MEAKKSNTNLQAKNFVRPGIFALFVLLIAFVANMTVDGFNWGPGDFVGMGLFVYVFGLIFEVAMTKITKYKKLVGALIFVIFMVLYGLMATTE